MGKSIKQLIFSAIAALYYSVLRGALTGYQPQAFMFTVCQAELYKVSELL